MDNLKDFFLKSEYFQNKPNPLSIATPKFGKLDEKRVSSPPLTFPNGAFSPPEQLTYVPNQHTFPIKSTTASGATGIPHPRNHKEKTPQECSRRTSGGFWFILIIEVKRFHPMMGGFVFAECIRANGFHFMGGICHFLRFNLMLYIRLVQRTISGPKRTPVLTRVNFELLFSNFAVT